jgi:hypothetical protein
MALGAPQSELFASLFFLRQAKENSPSFQSVPIPSVAKGPNFLAQNSIKPVYAKN